MTDKPPLWADLLLTVWVLVVAVLFFGVTVAPAVGLWTGAGAGFYTLMLMVSAVTLAVKYLTRNDAPKPPPPRTQAVQEEARGKTGTRPRKKR